MIKQFISASALSAALALCAFALPMASNADCSADPTHSSKYDALIAKFAKLRSVKPDFIRAVIWRESRFNYRAVGKAGEIGLMQITVGAATDWARANNYRMPSRSEMFKPSLNIRIGSWYLARAKSYWTGRKARHACVLALCEYNAGRTGTRRSTRFNKKGEIVIKSSQLHNYVSTIVKRYNQYVAIRRSTFKNVAFKALNRNRNTRVQ